MVPITSKDNLRQANRKLVLQEIVNSEYTTRVAISRKLGLNKSTISSIYDDLKKEQLVEEVGEGAASHAGGRKPTNIKLHASYGFTMSFDISFRNLHFMINYLDSSVIEQSEISIYQKSIQEILAIIEAKIDQTLQTVQSVRGLLGICLSIHGIVNERQAITYSPFVDFDNLDLRQLLMAKYQVPVVLENESNLTAVYVRDFMPVAANPNLVAISIHKGIGSGIILNQRLFRGFKGQAGEIGRTLIKTAEGKLIPVEQICSEDSIINYLKTQLKTEKLNRGQVIALYRAHNKAVILAMNTFVAEISTLIYNASMYFDTGTVYLGSPLMEEATEIFDQVAESVQRLNNNAINLHLLANSDMATLFGACSVITHQVLDLVGYQLNFSGVQK
ncbi:transcriptional regulator [Agrilactobacillus composti DSM 18527 = JCM 14202]|uniref:Transcriptional regulator n=1 Tax=Agrilactobacillus composti DSM 18527 = JCM 14202 TaxID=1423734 RepID=X0QJI2_9LACO|nr:ROK family protein [Agrilactobacillus composti]KRM34903.1 transcriptional regulator [Agrilactobacillus composti DSM 18527 = JCM 14202]GAF38780.1 xylose repressor [Agrilactobacillus composti DSM 18527 = JCM 14202]